VIASEVPLYRLNKGLFGTVEKLDYTGCVVDETCSLALHSSDTLMMSTVGISPCELALEVSRGQVSTNAHLWTNSSEQQYGTLSNPRLGKHDHLSSYVFPSNTA
jgi:hypothetical protein